MSKRETEFWTAMIDTTLKYTYTETCFFLLLWWEADIWPVLSWSLPAPAADMSTLLTTNSLTDLPNWSWSWKLSQIFSGRPHIFPSGTIHMIHFCCPLLTLRYSCIFLTSTHILFMKITLTSCQRSICNTHTHTNNITFWGVRML